MHLKFEINAYDPVIVQQLVLSGEQSSGVDSRRPTLAWIEDSSSCSDIPKLEGDRYANESLFSALTMPVYFTFCWNVDSLLCSHKKVNKGHRMGTMLITNIDFASGRRLMVKGTCFNFSQFASWFVKNNVGRKSGLQLISHDSM